MVTTADAGRQGAHRLRAKPGPRAGHGLARPRPPRLQLPPHATSPARSASPSSTASTTCSPAAPRAAGWYREPLAGIEGLELPCEDTGGDLRGWFVFVVQLPRGVDRDETVRALRERGVQSKPYLPAIHLMTFYRERFGHREGEFPVCEDVAARSLALPFFPELTRARSSASPRRCAPCCSR